MSGVDERIAMLSPAKQRVLQLWRSRARSALDPTTVVHHDDGVSVPASFAQRRLWFLDRFDPNGFTYNNAHRLHLRGPLDVDRLCLCVNEIIRRHEPLRTTFESVDGEPHLHIRPHTRMQIPLTDLSGRGANDRAFELDRIISVQATAPFDLANGPLVRLRIIRLGAHEHVLLYVVHHIVSDRWSVAVFVEELLALYEALREGRPSPLRPLNVRYRDYASQQRRRFDNPTMQRQVADWKKRLGDPPTMLDLPTDRPRPKMLSTRGARYTLRLEESLVGRLKRLGQEERATLFMVTLAAFEVLLHRYSGQDDFVMATAVAGRSHIDLEPMVGLFVNLVPLRAELKSQASFRQLLGCVRARVLESLKHAEVPFEKLVDALQMDRDTSQLPLGQAAFNFHNVPAPKTVGNGLTVQVSDVELAAARFELLVTAHPAGAGLDMWFDYSSDLYDRETIERMTGHYETLLEAVVHDPDSCVGRLPLLTDQERHQLLVQWNDTATEYPRELCIHELIEARVSETPDAPAVVFRSRRLSYGQLNAAANQVAHTLRAMGVRPETRVGLCIDRGPDMIIGLLGILKAGGVYVPIDPAYPPERLSFVLDDCRASVVLTQEHLLESLPEHGGQSLCLDRDRPQIAAARVDNPESLTTPDCLAYVIYTSGSTGCPKAALLEHRGLCSLSEQQRRAFGITPHSRILQSASLSFDASIFEIIMALPKGATLYLGTREELQPGRELLEFLRRHEITIVTLTPTVLAVIPFGSLPALQTITVAGEACPLDIVTLWAPGRRFFNLYGPTETLIWATMAELFPDGSAPHIGRPIANTQVYILDANLQPVPVGVPGELHIGGVGLARGYHRRPDLTRERFIASPFLAGARLYKTGDRGRFRADGTIEFLGRIDHQIKLRGFRIELGEIEAVLNNHADVAQSVVVLREDRPGNTRLVAYCVPAAGRALEFSALRSDVRAKLPDYMVPSAFVGLHTLPLTPSGKVNRRALPPPGDCRPETDTAYVAPHNRLEEQLASIWSDVLGIERVGIHDNLFELGGHSLKAVVLASRIGGEMDVELPVSQVFRLPTIAQLAQEVESRQNAGEREEAGGIDTVSRDERLPLSFGEEGMLFLDRQSAGRGCYNVPLAIRLRGPLDVSILERSFNAIAARHEVLRTGYEVDDKGPFRVIVPGSHLKIETFDLGHFERNEINRPWQDQLTDWVRQPFDLSQPPLMRVRLWRLGDKDHVLAVVLHHIVCDEWSVREMLDELTVLYQAGGDADRAGLAQPLVQMADVAAWQRRSWEGGRWQDQLSYWRERLAGAPAALALATDRPRPAVQSYAGDSLSIDLSADITEALRVLGRQAGATLFMTMLAAFKALLLRYTQQQDIVVGSPIANRQRFEVRHTVGLFLNTLPFRTDLSGDPTSRQLLGRVRETALGVYGHADVPFEKLVGNLGVDRDASANPVFQVAFVLLNEQEEGVFRPEGIESQSISVSTGTSKFDLMLSFQEVDGGLRGKLEYSTDLFDAETIQRMAGHLGTLVAGIVADPDCRISRLPLVTESERHQLLVKWNQTAVDYPREKCIHELFEEQVSKAPDSPALMFGNKSLSYRDLDRQANQLAGYLQSLGVTPETIVGLCMQRSIDIAVAVLGILKSGGTCLPLDPSHPPFRLGEILTDARASIVLTHSKCVGRLARCPGHVICVDHERQTLRQFTGSRPDTGVRSGHLAYVLYTSGSTGRPKGVAMHHRCFVNLIKWQQDHSICGPGSKTLQFAPTGFDVSFQEMFATWCNGGLLVLVDDEVRQDLRSVLQLINQHRVNRLFLPPVALQQVADLVTSDENAPVSLREVVTAGEQLRVTPSVRKLFQKLGSGVLVNQYGPTETHVVSCYKLPAAPDSWPDLPPIGRPIANARLYVLDDGLQPVPVGVGGQLYVGGVCPAQGYLLAPDLTAARFIPDPFSDDPGARLYHTGDRCRYLPNGNIEFLGRVDDQVKLRGYRIEPGEIEATLTRHPLVRQAAVTVREDGQGDRKLVGYVVPAIQPGPSCSVWRDHLRQTLPDYMIPSVFMTVESLPITLNGKIDRKALPKPNGLRHDTKRALAPARNELEQRLVAMWKDVLGVDEVGIEDDFFDLGGHSLLVLRLFVQIERHFGRTLPLTSLFRAPTVGRLAALLNQAAPGDGFNAVVTLEAEGNRPALFILPGVGGHPFSFRPLVRILGPGQPVYALQLPGLDGRQEPLTCVEDMASYFIPQIVKVQPDGPYHLTGYSFGGLVAYEIARQLTQQGHHVGLVALLDARLFNAARRRPLLQRLALHGRRMSQLDVQGQLRYLLDRWGNLKRRFHRQREADHDKGRESTITQNLDCVSRASRQAFQNYKPQPYPGRGLLFQAQSPDWAEFCVARSDNPWRELFRGGLELQQIHVGHLDVFGDTVVPVLARKIRAILNDGYHA